MRLSRMPAATRTAPRLVALIRLDMNENVSDHRVSRLDRVLHLMRDLVPAPHGQIALNHNMQIHVVIEPHFANETFLDFDDTGNSRRNGLDLLRDPRPG